MRRLLLIVALAVACSSPESAPSDIGSAPTADVAVADVGTVVDLSSNDLGTPVAEDMALPTPSSPSYGTLNLGQLERMQETAMSGDDGPFYMVNFIRFRPLAEYADGRETSLTGKEANALYNPIEILFEIGARPVFFAEVSTNLPLGDGSPWDEVAVVRYPSRAAFLSMIQREDFQERSVHKDAGVEKSIVLVTHPLDLGLPEDFVPAEPPYPATDEDPAFEMVHVMSFRDVAMYEDDLTEPMRTGEEAVAIYSQNAGEVAAPLGVFPRAWFEVEGELIGDGRDWHQVRINHFPSGETFRQLTSNTDWAAGTHHRDAGLADTYSLMTAPILVNFE